MTIIFFNIVFNIESHFDAKELNDATQNSTKLKEDIFQNKNSASCCRVVPSKDPCQGDQTGRIFTYLVIPYFEHFLKYRSSQKLLC
jgi:hypothetical protein